MPVLGLIYPCSFFAERFDPLRVGNVSRTAGNVLDGQAVLRSVEQQVESYLHEIVAQAPTHGQFDEQWYWAVPLLLDQRHNRDAVREWFDREGLEKYWRGETDSSAADSEQSSWEKHVQKARDVLDNGEALGRPPADLAGVLAQTAIAGPSVVALRSLGRICGGAAAINDPDVRDFAGSVGWGFRSLFNLPEVTSMIRGMNGAEPYWRRVLEYCVNGCLQAVMDEYVHVLQESLGVVNKNQYDKADEVSCAVADAVSLRVAQPRVDDIRRNTDGVVAIDEQRIMRARFAMRFGDDSGEEEIPEPAKST